MVEPDLLLRENVHLFDEVDGPIVDLACGNGHNGIFLASRGFSVLMADKSLDTLREAEAAAEPVGAEVKLWQVDLEQPDINPLKPNAFGAILVFRYLHRPLIPCIRKAIQPGGILMYETFTLSQRRFGRPRNPAYLLEQEELRLWFKDWEILHYLEEIKEDPRRAIAQLICRKPHAAR
jgi:SAM-dependent methyltransferase